MILAVLGSHSFFLCLTFELFSCVNYSRWSGRRSRLFPVAPSGHQRTSQQWLQLQQHLRPQHLKFAGKMNLAKKLLLPTHPVPISTGKGCWGLHSSFPGNTAEDSTVPSVLLFLKPPSHSTWAWSATATHWLTDTRTFLAMLSKWWFPQSRTDVSGQTKKGSESWAKSQEVNAISALLCHRHCGDCCRCFLDQLLLFWRNSFLWSRELCYTISLDILFKIFCDCYIGTTADFTTESTSTDPLIPPTTEMPYSMAV